MIVVTTKASRYFFQEEQLPPDCRPVLGRHESVLQFCGRTAQVVPLPVVVLPTQQSRRGLAHHGRWPTMGPAPPL